MSKTYRELNAKQCQFIANQKMFFVGTAPLSEDGHVNISPKGMDSFRVIDSTTVAYIDLTGSGVETLSHVKENGRLVIMFCAFEGSPLTLRLYGKAEAIEVSHQEFPALKSLFPDLPAVRSIIRLKTTRIADSCGWTVPLYDFIGTRDYFDKYAASRGTEGIREGQLASNMRSLDDLPGLQEPSV